MDLNRIFEENNTIFNSPIEFALRCLCIINNENNQGIDLERIVYYDYLILNTGDFTDIESIHPPLPFRGAQVLIKREIIKIALRLLLSKQLIDIKFSNSGIRYYKNNLTHPFIGFLESEYLLELNERISWVSNHFHTFNDANLTEYISLNLEKWGGEFIKESIFRNSL
jgi:hypothetical protein